MKKGVNPEVLRHAPYGADDDPEPLDPKCIRYDDRKDLAFLLQTEQQMKERFFGLAADELEAGREPEAVLRGFVDACVAAALPMPPDHSLNTIDNMDVIATCCSAKCPPSSEKRGPNFFAVISGDDLKPVTKHQ